MRKLAELQTPSSCLNRASMGEMLFVLLGRDHASPATIRFWAQERIRIGKNLPSDTQITEAIACAEAIELEQRKAREAAKQRAHDASA